MLAELRLNLEYCINLFDGQAEKTNQTNGRRKRSRSIDSTTESRVITFIFDEDSRELKFLDQMQKDLLISFADDCLAIITGLVRDGRDVEELSARDATQFTAFWLTAQNLDQEARRVIDKINLPDAISEIKDAFAEIPVAVQATEDLLEENIERKSPRLELKFG